MKGGPEAWVREEILALKAYAVAPAQGMVKLDAMENPYRLPEPIRKELGAVVAEAAINRYPDPAAPALKARLRETMSIPAGLDVLIGNGSDELITLAAQALARSGAAMLAPEPTFAMYRMNALFSRMRYVGVPLRRDFTLDLDAVLAAIEAHQPALVFVAYPNNPTGTLFPEDAVAKIVAASPGLAIVDEAYEPFAQRTFMPRLSDFPNLIVMRTVSKLGLAGIRLGYAVGRPEWMRELDKVRPPYNVSVLTQAVAERALEHTEILAAQAREIRAERDRLHRALAVVPDVEVFPSAANFLLVRVPDAPRVFAGMKSRGVLVRSFHGSHPLLEHCLRVTVGTPEENRAMLDALHESLR